MTLDAAIRVAAIQLSASSWDVKEDEDAVAGWVRMALTRGAGLIVLPELAATPYFPVLAKASSATAYAQPIPGPLTQRMGAVLREVGGVHYLALPMVELGQDGQCRNVVVLLNQDGVIVPLHDPEGRAHTVAHKLHLPFSDRPGDSFDERRFFVPGSHYGYWDTELGRIGALVCFDRRFPEAWRALRALDVEIVMVPVAGSGGDSSDFFIAEMRTHARENGVIAVAANKVGVETPPDGSCIRHHGDSLVIDPYGEVRAHRTTEAGPGLLTATVSRELVRRARTEMPYFDVVRRDLYGQSSRRDA